MLSEQHIARSFIGMSTAAITILGLGPGSFQDLTRQAYTLLQEAAEHTRTVYFRTLIHPTVEPLQKALPQLQIVSFDHLYDESDDWQSLYQQIANEVCRQAAAQPLIYAVPGHPLIGESSVQLLLQQARERGLTTTVISGLSFLEPVCTLLSLDPFDNGAQIIDATALATLRPDEMGGKVIPTVPLLVAQVYNRRLASGHSASIIPTNGSSSSCAPPELTAMRLSSKCHSTNLTIIHLPIISARSTSRPCPC
jgi:tetrapyrrole methylase family protein / MazG family protein